MLINNEPVISSIKRTSQLEKTLPKILKRQQNPSRIYFICTLQYMNQVFLL